MARIEEIFAEPNSLRLRALSAVVLAPLAIGAIWFGWPWLPILTSLAGGGMAWEWCRLCGGGRLGPTGIEAIAIVVATIAVAAYGTVLVAVGMSLVGALGEELRYRRPAERPLGSLALGMIWISLPCVLLLWLARLDAAGPIVLLWVFATVWATDIGAYAVGRRLGGPLLAPRWSPRKTWAGLLGGMVCAALVGGATALILNADKVFSLVLLSAALAIVEQFGDLAESVAKRRFGVKDSSGLIPGHGGLLDRLDGLLAVIPAVALLTAIGGGSSVLAWR